MEAETQTERERKVSLNSTDVVILNRHPTLCPTISSTSNSSFGSGDGSFFLAMAVCICFKVRASKGVAAVR